MIQVLVVEDEAPIGRSLKSIIEAAGECYKVIGLVYNGREALDFIADHEPDLIITDIRMPIMSGLQLVKEVREWNPSIEIVLLSGYQEFEYAREAMSLGVTHYLLKPVSKLQIQKVLASVYTDILSKKKEQYSRYVSSLVNLKAKEDSVVPELYESQMLLLICAGPMPVYSFYEDIPGKRFWERNGWEEEVSAELGTAGDLYVLNGKSVSEKWVIIAYYNRIQGGNRLPEEWAAAIAERLGNEMPVSILYSERFSDIRFLEINASGMRALLYKNMILGSSILIPIRDGGEHYLRHDPANEPIFDRKLSIIMEQQYFDRFKAEITKMIEGWEASRPRQSYVEQSLARTLEGVLYASGTSRMYMSEIPEYVEFVIMNAMDYSDIARYMCEFIDSLYLIHKEDNDDERASEVLADKIEKYITEHFAEPIDHRLLSEQFGLVPSYLSKLFSKYKGISPAKYIVRLRIEAAKELLLDHPELLAKDIAFVIGYTDPSYFSRIFKRETGYYPSEFRDKFLSADER